MNQEAGRGSIGRRGQVRNWIIAAVLALLAAVLFSDHLTSPFDRSHQGWNGGHYGLAARNFLRYGYLEVGFMVCDEPGAVVAQPALYLQHPPMSSLLASVSVRVLGESELALRLPSYLLSVATVILLFLWLLRAFQGRALLAAAASITAMATPVWGYYAHHLEPLGPGALFSLVGSLLFADRWFHRRRLADLLACFAFLLFGFLTDWPVFYVSGFLGLLCLVGKERPGWRWCLVHWAFALLCGIGFLWWIRHVGKPTGFGLEQLWATALHRVGWAVGFVDDAGNSIGRALFFRWLFDMHQRMFLQPVSVLGAGTSVVLALRFMRGKDTSRDALWLVPLGVGLVHIAIFPQAAFQHEYLQFLLSVGLAVPTFALFLVCTRQGGMDRAVLVLSLLILVVGAWRVHRLWLHHDDAITTEQAAGRMIRSRLAPDEIFLSNGAQSLTFATVFYADRKNALARDPGAVVELASEPDSRIGGILLREEDVAVFQEEIERLGWEGPLRTPGYAFWDARP